MAGEKDLSTQSILQAVSVDYDKWNKIPGEEEIQATKQALKKAGISVIVVDNRQEALEEVKKLISPDGEVMTGSSTTLNEIGFTDYLLEGSHSWKNLHAQVAAESDWGKQAELRRKAVTAEYFVSSVNAVTKDGKLVASDASGSRVGAMPFAAKKLVLVAGANKIVEDIEQALARIREYAFPLENERAKRAYGMGSAINKIVALAGEMQPDRITLVLVREKLGF